MGIWHCSAGCAFVSSCGSHPIHVVMLYADASVYGTMDASGQLGGGAYHPYGTAVSRMLFLCSTLACVGECVYTTMGYGSFLCPHATVPVCL